MDKQGLHAEESWWQNSSISKSKNENETKIWIEKDGFKTGIRFKIRLKNGTRFASKECNLNICRWGS